MVGFVGEEVSFMLPSVDFQVDGRPVSVLPGFVPQEIAPDPTLLQKARIEFERVEADVRKSISDPVFEFLERKGITTSEIADVLVGSTPLAVSPTRVVSEPLRQFQKSFVEAQLEDLKENPLENIALVVGGGVAGKVVKGLRSLTLTAKGANALARTDKALGALGVGAGAVFGVDVVSQLTEAKNVEDVSRILGLATKDAFLFIAGFKIGGKQFFTFPKGKKGQSRFAELESFFKKEGKKKSALTKDDITLELQWQREGRIVRAKTKLEQLEDVRKILNEARAIEDPIQRREFLKNAKEIFESAFGKQRFQELVSDWAAQEGLFVPTQTQPRLAVETLESLEGLVAGITKVAPVGLGVSKALEDTGLPSSLVSKQNLFFKSQEEMIIEEQQRQPLLTLTKQEAIQKQKQSLILGSAAESLLGQDVIQKQRTIQRTMQITKQKQLLKTAQKLKQKQRLKQALKLKLAKPIPLSKIPRIKKLLSSPYKIKKGKVLKNVDAYDVYIKRFGKFGKIADDLPKNRAIRFGALVTDRNLGATYKIKKDPKGKVRIKDIKQFKPNTKIFRDFKISKGKKVPLKNTWIEKRGSRLNTRTELLEIKQARRQSGTRKKKKQTRKKKKK